MDFITDLPKGKQGHDAILTVVDQGFSKAVKFIACRKTCSAAELGNLLFTHIFALFGLPDKIISDRGPQFASHVFQSTCQGLGITSAMSTAFHPQMDGESEHVNQEIEGYLRTECGHDLHSWEEK